MDTQIKLGQKVYWTDAQKQTTSLYKVVGMQSDTEVCISNGCREHDVAVGELTPLIKSFRYKADAVNALLSAPTIAEETPLRFFITTSDSRYYYAESYRHLYQSSANIECIGSDGFSNWILTDLSRISLKSLTHIYNHLYQKQFLTL